MFITFEGADGVGKTTQIQRMRDALSQMGEDVILTREPGGTPGAEEIRSIILNGDKDRWSAETELLLFNAARKDHVERRIQPALDDGKIVLCDRYVDCTRAYQAVRNPHLRYQIDILHRTLIGLDPDLTIILDMPGDAGLRRTQTRAGALPP